MKKLSVVIVLSAWLFQACNNNTKSNGNTVTDSAAKDLTAVKDTSPKMAITPEKEDVEFVNDAASGGMTEVELGKLAQQQAQNNRLKSFGAMMVADHSKANNELANLARAKHINLPGAPNTSDQQVIDKLTKTAGKDFDKAYTDDMIDDHKNDIKTFENATKNCKDPDIRAFAKKTLPVLKAHLDAINAIHDSMK
jgi:putative membrane protein